MCALVEEDLENTIYDKQNSIEEMRSIPVSSDEESEEYEREHDG